MGALPAGGAMVAVQASEQEVLQTLAGFRGPVAWRRSTVPLGGGLRRRGRGAGGAGVWEERGRKTKRLRVSHAFHSPADGGDARGVRGRSREGVVVRRAAIPVVSNVTGEPLADAEICSAEYWVRHVREPVRFADGVRWLGGQGVRSFLELGPDGVLSAMVQECLAAAELDGGRQPAASRAPRTPRTARASRAPAAVMGTGAGPCHGAAASRASGAGRVARGPGRGVGAWREGRLGARCSRARARAG